MQECIQTLYRVSFCGVFHYQTGTKFEYRFGDSRALMPESAGALDFYFQSVSYKRIAAFLRKVRRQMYWLAQIKDSVLLRSDVCLSRHLNMKRPSIMPYQLAVKLRLARSRQAGEPHSAVPQYLLNPKERFRSYTCICHLPFEL